MPKIPAMDFATIIGLLLAWGAVVYSMFHASHGALGAYIKPSEIFLVFGGSIGAAMLSMPLHSITGALNYLKKWLFNTETHVEHLIKEMVGYAETAAATVSSLSNPSRAKHPIRSCAAASSSP